ncbi:MAG: SWIM zinc finger family protein [PVC group bacterium]
MIMTFADLTWEDLKDWAGDRVVSRSKSYKRAVEDLRVTADGALLAWVQGGDRYATLARMDAAGKLSSECTCPYSWGPCKHAVAVILAYLDAAKNMLTPPPADPDDERFAELAEADGDRDDGDEDIPPLAAASRVAKENKLVRTHLEGLSKKELVDLLLEGRDSIPELRRQLSDRADVREGNTAKLIAATRREIAHASDEPGWTNHWRGESHIPDYSRVKQRLENLLAAGRADAVIELGAYLMKRGIRQVEQSHDEGETGMEIADCMAVVFKAVKRSSLSASQRLLWEINLRLADEYSFLDGLKGFLAAGSAGKKADWSQVADVLFARLDKLPQRQAGSRDDFSAKFDREQIMLWLLGALEKAGRTKEVIPLLERETAKTDCYIKLVDKLIESGQTEKAREWAKKGFIETLAHAPGIAWHLEEQLRKLAVRARNYPLAAAYCALKFFDNPNLQLYSELEKAAVKAGVWDTIRGPILTYLETGRRPDIAPHCAAPPVSRREKRPRKTMDEVSVPLLWPLPSPELPERKKEARWSCFPDTATLIDIAIKEKRHDDALRWYRQRGKPGVFGCNDKGEKIARAVQETHPDNAIAIWKELASREIAQVKPAAYQAAGGYLKKIRAVFERTQRTSEWIGYLSKLREQNNRRPRMLEVLNSLEGRRTPIVRS